MRKITWQDRLRYQIDNWMSHGAIAVIVILIGFLLLLVVTAALFLQITGMNFDAAGNRMDLPTLLWQTFIHAEDSSAITADRVGLVYTSVMMVVTIGGILFFSAFIGVLAAGFQGKIEQLRRGRSFVVEKGHTLILGWSPMIFAVIEQLVWANQDKARSCIVILAEMDKVAMEDAVRSRVKNLGHTRVVCRSGKPTDLHDLAIVNPRETSAIIVLSPQAPDPDSDVLKTLLAILQDPQRRRAPYHVVAQMQDAKSVRLAKMVGGTEVVPARLGDVLWMATVQAVRHVRLSVVLTTLLNFEGNEIYFQAEPLLVGKSFGEALLAYPASTVIGVRAPDGNMVVAPPMETRLQAEDKLIIIANNAAAIQLGGAPVAIDESALATPIVKAALPWRLLILGWNRDVKRMVQQLDDVSAPGGTMTLVALHPTLESELDGLELRHTTLTLQTEDPRELEVLNALNVPSYDRVVVLSDSDAKDAQAADAQALIILLQLRELRQSATNSFGIVTQMMDSANRELAQVMHVDDVIVSDEFLSYLLAQVSQERDRLPVLLELASPQGKEMFLKPIGEYVSPGQATNFYTAVEAAKRCGQVALGYCREAEKADAQKIYGVHLNPPKEASVLWAEQDRLIVVAESLR